MNKDKIRLVIQGAFKTGLALCGVAIGGAILIVSRERLQAAGLKRSESMPDVAAKYNKNAARRAKAAAAKASKAKAGCNSTQAPSMAAVREHLAAGGLTAKI